MQNLMQWKLEVEVVLIVSIFNIYWCLLLICC